MNLHQEPQTQHSLKIFPHGPHFQPLLATLPLTIFPQTLSPPKTLSTAPPTGPSILNPA